jgi:hypothetical protein
MRLRAKARTWLAKIFNISKTFYQRKFAQALRKSVKQMPEARHLNLIPGAGQGSVKLMIPGESGGWRKIQVNPRLKKLMKELGEAINGSLSESEQIAQVITRIKEEGFDIFLVLEATIGFNRHEEQGAPGSPELVTMRNKKNPEPDFSINANDVRFLKSLRISVEE